jgi:hypothetical protein
MSLDQKISSSNLNLSSARAEFLSEASVKTPQRQTPRNASCNLVELSMLLLWWTKTLVEHEASDLLQIASEAAFDDCLHLRYMTGNSTLPAPPQPLVSTQAIDELNSRNFMENLKSFMQQRQLPLDINPVGDRGIPFDDVTWDCRGVWRVQKCHSIVQMASSCRRFVCGRAGCRPT